MTLDVSDLMIKGKTGDVNMANYNKSFNTKKIVNGEVIAQHSLKGQSFPTGPLPFESTARNGLNLQAHKSNIINKLDGVISEGLRVRNNNIGFGS